ncbi:hypothetical protein [Burkholderia phage BCSR5]|nr:hypothetical protein [Burkholderia phage BCSR5]
MAKQDLRVNDHGIDVRDLKPGMWITVWWYGKGDERIYDRCLLLEVEEKPHNFKGVRDITVFVREKKGLCINRFAQHDQVVEIHGMLSTDSVPLSQ